LVTRLVAKVTLTLAAEALLCLSAQSQTTYHFHKETASASYYLLSTAGPDAASTTLTTSDLKGKTGSAWIANWATAAGVPNSAGTVPANSTFQFSLWMNKSASFGTIYPIVMVGKLDAKSKRDKLDDSDCRYAIDNNSYEGHVQFHPAGCSNYGRYRSVVGRGWGIHTKWG